MPLSSSMPKSVLLVCLGNICRSPTAEGILRQRVAIAGLTLDIDSAGTSNWHIGEHPDPRAQKYAKKNGYNISNLTARQVTTQDFVDFDLILAMDTQNLKDLQDIKSDAALTHSPDDLAKLALMTEPDDSHCNQDIPDPYQGGTDDFIHVINLLESASDAWIDLWQS